MKFESKYLAKNISKKYKNGFILVFLIGPVLTIGLWAIYLSTTLPDNSRRAIGKVINGIKTMPMDEFLIAAICGIPMAGLIILMGQALHGQKRIIVSMEFNHELELLILKTQKITKYKLEQEDINYSKLRIRTEHKIYDGMSMDVFEGIEFLNNGKYVGYLLKNHFSWSKSEIDDISLELTKIGKAPNLF